MGSVPPGQADALPASPPPACVKPDAAERQVIARLRPVLVVIAAGALVTVVGACFYALASQGFEYRRNAAILAGLWWVQVAVGTPLALGWMGLRQVAARPRLIWRTAQEFAHVTDDLLERILEPGWSGLVGMVVGLLAGTAVMAAVYRFLVPDQSWLGASLLGAVSACVLLLLAGRAYSCWVRIPTMRARLEVAGLAAGMGVLGAAIGAGIGLLLHLAARGIVASGGSPWGVPELMKHPLLWPLLLPAGVLLAWTAISEQLDPKLLQLRYWMHSCDRAVARAWDKEDYGTVVACLSELLAAGPPSAGLLAERGVAFASDRQPARALADLDEAIRLRPGDARLCLFVARERGWARLDARDYGGAAAAFEEALKAEGRHGPSHAGLGLAKKGLGNLDAALACLEQGTALYPQSRWAWAAKVLVLRELGRGEEAEAALKAFGHACGPKAAEDAALGSIYLRISEPVAAAACLERAVASAGAKEWRPFFDLGVARFALGDGASGMAILRQAAERVGGEPERSWIQAIVGQEPRDREVLRVSLRKHRASSEWLDALVGRSVELGGVPEPPEGMEEILAMLREARSRSSRDVLG